MGEVRVILYINGQRVIAEVDRVEIQNNGRDLMIPVGSTIKVVKILKGDVRDETNNT